MTSSLGDILDYNKIPWKMYNISKRTGVVRFSYGNNYIWIEFNDKRIYLYDEAANGKRAIEAMKQLAEKGEKLSTFINQHDEVRDNYVIRYRWTDGVYLRF